MALKPIDIVLRTLGADKVQQDLKATGDAGKKAGNDIKQAGQQTASAWSPLISQLKQAEAEQKRLAEEARKTANEQRDAAVRAAAAVGAASKEQKQAAREAAAEARIAAKQAEDAARAQAQAYKDAARAAQDASRTVAAANRDAAKAASDAAKAAADAPAETGVSRRALLTGGGLAAAGAGAAGVAISNSLADKGSDAVEAQNLIKESFGESTEEINAWSENLRSQLGINALELRKNAATFNLMFGSMGLTTGESLKLSKSLSELGNDMASFYNLKPEEAFEKLRAGITGESEPLKSLGVVITEETTKQYAYANGIAKVGEELTEQQKVLSRYGQIMQATAKAQGDLQRTLDSPANIRRRRQADQEQAQAALGVGAANFRAGVDQAAASLLSIVGANEAVAASFGWTFAAGSHIMAVGGSAITTGSELVTLVNGVNAYKAAKAAQTATTLASAGAAGVEAGAVGAAGATTAAAGTAASGAAVGFGALAASLGLVVLALVAAAAAWAAYQGSKDAATMTDTDLKSKWGPLGSWWSGAGRALGDRSGVVTEDDKKLLDHENRRRAKRGESALTMEQFKGNSTAEDAQSVTQAESPEDKIKRTQAELMKSLGGLQSGTPQGPPVALAASNLASTALSGATSGGTSSGSAKTPAVAAAEANVDRLESTLTTLRRRKRDLGKDASEEEKKSLQGQIDAETDRLRNARDELGKAKDKAREDKRLADAKEKAADIASKRAAEFAAVDAEERDSIEIARLQKQAKDADEAGNDAQAKALRKQIEIAQARSAYNRAMELAAGADDDDPAARAQKERIAKRKLEGALERINIEYGATSATSSSGFRGFGSLGLNTMASSTGGGPFGMASDPSRFAGAVGAFTTMQSAPTAQSWSDVNERGGGGGTDPLKARIQSIVDTVDGYLVQFEPIPIRDPLKQALRGRPGGEF